MYSLQWVRDGQALLAVDHQNAVRMWRADNGEELPMPDVHFRAFSAAETAQGLLVTGVQDRETLVVWRFDDGRVLMQVPLRGYPAGNQKNRASGLVVNPDGSVLAVLSTRSIWLLRVADGSTIAYLQEHRAAIMSMAWSPDGTRLASASGVPFALFAQEGDRTVRIYGGANGEPLHVLEGTDAGMPALAWSPSGDKIAAGGLDRKVYIWTLQ